MCARALHPLAEMCLGYGVAKNTLFYYLDCSGPQGKMVQMLNGCIRRLQILKHLFLVILFFEISLAQFWPEALAYW